MSYLHKKTFDIINSVDFINNAGDYFEADELIALPVQALNRKGYITEWSCAGHPFDDLIDFGKIFPNALPENFPERLKDETRKRMYRSYIVFEKGISLPELPPEFVIEDDFELKDERICICIKKHFEGNDFFRMLRDIIASMEQLYLWALNLPEKDDYFNK